MPLPAALLARLQKRGIVKSSEEIIAENYDGNNEKSDQESLSGAPGCPNRYNPHHICVSFCYDHWREGTPEHLLSESYLRKRGRMLSKYPLPDGWVEVYDCGVGRHYYWNKDTDEVCWLSPRHPAAVVGEAAPRIARDNNKTTPGRGMQRSERDRPNRYSRDYRDDRAPPRRRRRSSSGSRSNSDTEDVAEMKEFERLKRAKRKGIDPMDPAAYGEAEVGGWSSGLRAHDKTGADVTASGPLFQQRPYPAPGAVLRQKPRDD